MAIRQAIQKGAFFLSIHSRARNLRDETYANEELVVAIDVLRKRTPEKPWLIPVKIDDSSVPDRSIGGGETLLDLNYCDLTDWARGVVKLLKSLDVENPKVDLGKPLAPGLPSLVQIEKGQIRFDNIPGVPSFMQGIELRVDKGWCQRQKDGRILTYLETVMPIQKLQQFNVNLGLTTILAVSEAKEISRDQSTPTCFLYIQETVLPRGTVVVDFMHDSEQPLPVDVKISSSFEAKGFLDNEVFSGKFLVRYETEPSIPGQPFVLDGSFSLTFSSPFSRAHVPAP